MNEGLSWIAIIGLAFIIVLIASRVVARKDSEAKEEMQLHMKHLEKMNR